MRKICVFCETWESGGIEAFLRNVLCTMSLEDFEIHLVAEKVQDSVFSTDMISAGIQFFSLSGNTRKFAENLYLFRKLLRKEQYDVLHLNIYQGLSLAYARVARKENIPVIIAHSHNTELRKSFLRPLKMLLHHFGSAAFANNATSFWACSYQAASFMFPSSLIKKKGYSFIPNGIDTHRFTFNQEKREQIRSAMGLQDSFVIGHVGRLCSQKNQLFLIELLTELVKERPECMLLLVGEGEDKQLLEQRAREIGVSEHVVLMGATKYVEELFWAMDVFAFPSLFEGLGIVAVEAQTAGLPVICSDSVPQETNITPLVSYISLSNREKWKRSILDSLITNRESYSALVKKKGFDISDVSKMISLVYKK